MRVVKGELRMISPKKITFNNKSNEDFNLICDLCFEGGDSGETSSFLSRKAVTTETYNGVFRRSYGMKYDEVLAPQFTLMKRNFEDFTFEEQRAVLSWLTGKHTASYMDIYMTDDDVVNNNPTYCLLGGITEIETYKLGNNRTVGIVFTFENLYPYALSPLKVIHPERINGTATYVLPCESDEIEAMVYPKITIKQADSLEISTGSTGEPSSANLINNAIYQNTSGDKYFIYNFLGSTPKKIDGYLISKELYSPSSVYEGKCYYLTDKKEIVVCVKDDYDNYHWVPLAKNVGGATRISIAYNMPEISEMLTPYDMEENTIYKDTPNNKYYFKYHNSVQELYIENSLPTADGNTVDKFYYNKANRVIYKGITFDGVFTKQEYYSWSIIAYDVKFEPSTDVIIRNNSQGETIVIDGANKIISTSSSRVVGDNFSWNWLALRRGENTIEVTGNCEISFEWRNPIKIGQF